MLLILSIFKNRRPEKPIAVQFQFQFQFQFLVIDPRQLFTVADLKVSEGEKPSLTTAA